MRLAYCYHCETMAKLTDYKGNPDYDSVLQDWVDRHLHGFSPDETGKGLAHPGGMLFPVDDSKSDIDRRVRSDRTGQLVTDERGDVIEMSNNEYEAVQAARAELRKVGKDIRDYRDELRDSSVKCHLAHGQPSYPDKPCIDYKADSKRIGRHNIPRPARQWLCTHCPYESTVTVAIRARRGDYR